MITIKLARTKDDKNMADKIVIDYHSYVNSAKTVGRCLKYLIFYNNRLVGTFWVGSIFKPTPKAILDYFKVSQKEFDNIFNKVADNKRFCLLVKIPNMGTQIISKVRKRVKNDWYEKYGDDLIAIVTTIGDGKKGSVYLADNWEYIGETSGLSDDRQSVSMKWNNKEQIKKRFVKPTGENKKKILITKKIYEIDLEEQKKQKSLMKYY